MSDASLTPTPVSDWKKSSGKAEADVPLPSGKVARLRRPGMEMFIRAGSIPNSLLPIVTTAIDKAKAGGDGDIPDDALEAMVTDPEKMDDIVVLVNRVTMESMVEPKAHPVPTEEELAGNLEERSDECDSSGRLRAQLYVDEVDLQDRFFIFNYAVGGTQDVERFRGELGGSVGTVRSGPAKPKPTKRTGGTRRR